MRRKGMDKRIEEKVATIIFNQAFNFFFLLIRITIRTDKPMAIRRAPEDNKTYFMLNIITFV